MNVAYMSVKHNSKEEFIHWDKFADYEIKKETKYVQHIRLQQALKIQIDGKKRITVITE
jgi:hypothetical protein